MSDAVMVAALKDDIFKNASNHGALRGAVGRMVAFFEGEVAKHKQMARRLRKFNHNLRKKLEESTNAKA